ncbi:predicted protein [Fibroporia radiculosa]|uniref:Uncharacterized protein n=1 Tax=Fibroporia radiculosa TaxID=599839 RepID=J4GIV6_9APHY|nr:predicted protein [Fibroporia radiculosa]
MIVINLRGQYEYPIQ